MTSDSTDDRPTQAPSPGVMVHLFRWVRGRGAALIMLGLVLVAIVAMLVKTGGANGKEANTTPLELRRQALSLEQEGKLEEALAAIETACRTGATYQAHAVRARILMELGRYQAMLTACRESILRFPRMVLGRYEIVALRGLDRQADAVAAAKTRLAQLKGRRVGINQAYMLAVLGKAQEARDDLKTQASGQYYLRSVVASVLRDRELTKRALEHAIDKRETIPPNAKVEPDLFIWNGDAEISALIEKMRAK